MKTIRLLTKAVLWILGIFLLLDVAIILAIRLPAVQNHVVQTAISWVSKKTESKITLDYVSIEFPLAIALDGLYAETPAGDTLGYIGHLAVGVQPLALLDNRLTIYKIDLENTTARISRAADSTFNFNYIITAFASDEPKDTASSDFDVYISQVNLKDVDLLYDDQLIDFYQRAKIGSLELDFDEFSLLESRVAVNSLNLSNVNSETRMAQSEETAPQDSTDSQAWTFIPGDVRFDNVNANLMLQDQLEAMVHIGTFSIEPERFDLENKTIHLNEVELLSSNISLTQFGSPDSTTQDQDKQSEQGIVRPMIGWDFAVSDLNVEQTKVRVDRDGVEALSKGFDANHLNLGLEAIDIEDIVFNDQEIHAEAQLVSVNLNDEWYVREVEFEATWNDEQASLTDFVFKTPNSKGKLSATLPGTELLAFLSDKGNARFEAEADLPVISILDAHYFAPYLDTNEWYGFIEDSPIALKATLEGNIKDLQIAQFMLSMDGVDASFSGNAQNLDSLKLASGTFQIENLKIQSRRLPKEIREVVLPEGITFPRLIAIRGQASGSMDKVKVNIRGSLDQQRFTINGKLNYRDSINSTYDLAASFADLPLGRYLQNDSLGDASVELKAKGKGWAASSRNIEASVKLIGFDFVEYDYATIQVDAQLKNDELEIQSAYSDSNLIYDLAAGFQIGVANPTYRLDLDLEGIDFQALKLVAYDARYTGHLKTSLTITEDKDIIGNLAITKLGVVRKGQEAFIDSLLMISAKDTGGYRLQAQSDLLKLNYTGNVPILELPDLAEALVDRHYGLGDTNQNYETSDKRFMLEVAFLRSDILNNLLIPGLSEYEPGEFFASFDGQTERFKLDLDIPRLQYDNLSLDSFLLHASADKSGLNASLYLETFAIDTLPIHNINLNAQLSENVMNARFSTGDTVAPDYAFALQGKSTETGFSVRVPEERVLLNKEEWKITPANAVISDAGNWKTEEFRLSQGDKSFEILAETSPTGVSMLMLDLKNFTISSLTGLLETDTALVEGEITGLFRLDSLDIDANIEKLAFMGYPAGEMRTQLHKNYGQGNFDVELNWIDEGHKVTVDGIIDPTADLKQLDVAVNFSPFNFALIQGLLVGQISDLEGTLNGELKISGPMKAPEFKGQLNVKDTRLKVDAIGTTYRIEDESIIAQNGQLKFQNFAISDSADNKLTLDGTATNQNYEDFELAMTVKAEDFRLLNAPRDSEKTLRGVMVVDLDANATGKLSQPMVKGKLKVEAATNLEIEVPRPDLKAQSYDGIVEFYDQDIEDHAILGRKKETSDSTRFDFLGVNATMDVQVDKQAQMKIIVDPISGDHLIIQGGGQLALNIDPFGNLTLTGTYQILRGSYKLSFYNLVKKEFSISPGSQIRWSGDPLKAQLMITAVYSTRVNPDNLFVGSSNASGSGGTVPIDVKLNLTGPLMEPEVDFDIVVPEDQKGAYGGRLVARLTEMNQNESELNKQVFGILVLNSFLQEDSGDDGSGSSSLARASASRILSSQLNKLGERYLKGVELSVNVDSYESSETSGSTDLELAVKKGFFDDRLQVQVGGDVALEGERTSEQSKASDYLGDVEVTYKLTDDGRYKLRAFRKNEFDDLLEGELIKTGIGVNYTRNYDRVEELFRKPEDTDEVK